MRRGETREKRMESMKQECLYRLDDGRLRVRVTATDPSTGKRTQMQRTLPRGATLEEAIEIREMLRDQVTPKRHARAWLRGIVTVGDYAVRWFSHKTKKLAPSTRRRYHDALDMRVLPYLGDIPVSELHRRDVIEWRDWLDLARQDATTGYSVRTRRGWWRVGKQMLGDLRADMELSQHLVDRIEPPGRDDGTPRRKDTLDPEQLVDVLELACKLDLQRCCEVWAIGTTGMRAGEMYGLLWSDIDYAGEVIHIRRSAAEGILTERPKTRESVRDVPLAPRLAAMLRELRKEQLQCERPKLEHNLVMPADHGGCRLSQSLYKPLDKLAGGVDLGIRLRPQTIRRTVNTILTNRHGELYAQAVLGHVDKVMTKHYYELAPEDRRRMMEDAFGPTYAPVSEGAV